MFFETSKQKLVLSKNGLIIAVGRLVKRLAKKNLRQEKKKWVLSKNGLRIAVGRLVKILISKKQYTSHKYTPRAPFTHTGDLTLSLRTSSMNSEEDHILLFWGGGGQFKSAFDDEGF